MWQAWPGCPGVMEVSHSGLIEGLSASIRFVYKRSPNDEWVGDDLVA